MVGSQIGCVLYRKAWRRAAVIDALTESVRAMLNREGVDDQQIRVPSGSCVDTERFRPEEKQPWVVFSGRLIPEKNPLLFVEACALVREQLKGQKPNFRMFILGAGPMEDEVRALVDQRGLRPWTHMGWMEHVESILGQASVFVSLQRMDNYPSQALLEAMASCAAVVATDVGLTWKLVDDEVGRRVPGTPESVAHAIIELLENPDHAAAMGRRARERVVRHHSLERYLDYIQAVYAAAK
jgi:glycosyltransferase involved in cell wall biosynthesis